MDPAARHQAVKRLPLPPGSVFVERSRRVDPNLDQDRVHFSPSMAMRYKRVYGLVAPIRPETRSANTTTAASAQLVTKVCWFSDTNGRWGRVFFRITVYSASYAPRIVSGAGTHLALGDAITGVVEAPHSGREATNLIAWDHVNANDWRIHAPFTLFSPNEREHLLFADVVATLPQLGGRPYAKNNRFHAVPSMRIQLPFLGTEVMRAISGREGTLDAVDAYIRDHSGTHVDASGILRVNPIADIPRGQPADVLVPSGPPPRFRDMTRLHSVRENALSLHDAPSQRVSLAITDEHGGWTDDGSVTHISAASNHVLGLQPSASEMMDALPPLTAPALAALEGTHVRLHRGTQVFDVSTSNDSFVVVQRSTPPT